jgi:hypothetical protein
VWKLVLELVIAAMAVIGFYTVLCAWGELFSVARPLTVAILVETDAELEGLDVWLAEAAKRTKGRGQAPVVLVAPSAAVRFLADDGRPAPAYAVLLERYGAAWHVLKG